MQAAMSVEKLNEKFAIPGKARILTGEGGLPKIHVTSSAAAAEIYLHGAHLTSWQPVGSEEVIFLSQHARWEEGRAIRGGIPVCFPWFRSKADNPQAPAHGFVRTTAWTLAAITEEQDSVTVALMIGNDEKGRRWWPHEFRLDYRIRVGASLRLELRVANTGSSPFQFEEALHTYYRVGSAEKIRVTGLDGAALLDNMDGNRKKLQHGDVMMSGPMDNAFLDTTSALELIDPVLRRRVRIEKENSSTTVVWNPWSEGAKALADLGDDEWRQMACVEASNILSSAILLAPGTTHTMAAIATVASEL